MELGVGRGNTTLALRAFEVSPAENKAQQLEGLEVIRRALHNDVFSYVGEHYKIPPRGLVPRGLQKPYPPIHMATGSPESSAGSGRTGSRRDRRRVLSGLRVHREHAAHLR
ncbi:LLM class flavin-dependent oxidoreductase [Gordonia humi]|uniref:LLM class flavin-dependent oxidoreductase n=1 Tax=Gordonia humi TaxID=686429 RepID=UPI00360AC0B9